ncbi:hypothetical protein CTEN210_06389 [Chaetoceros tenuissimus]|uniref:Uncharacterized protein n=1 Tax=Chaetoceros tenuissimus TaxID=426638 RepID=A0AAD3CPS2_9STRA|nr:hypothetical protein CTEN210_06389 [Chaetoceros tenuissimus]
MDFSTLENHLHFIKHIDSNGEWKDKKYRDEVMKIVQACNKKLEDALGKSMHRLEEHRPSIPVVEKVVKMFPATLSYRDNRGRLPIHKAAEEFSNAIEYVPVLAKQWIKQKVGGKNLAAFLRGGLLVVDPDDDNKWNALQCVCYNYRKEKERFDVLKDLQQSGLLLKKDIQEQSLLFVALHDISSRTSEIFDFFTSWDPSALLESRYKGKSLLYSVCNEFYNESVLFLVLDAGFRHYPRVGGFLFIEEDEEGNTPLDNACTSYGEDKVMTILQKILSCRRDFPILHFICFEAPERKGLFFNAFPWAYHLRDDDGRSLHQAILAAGPGAMEENDHLLASISDDQIREKDPKTTLYPFAAMAVGEHADLNKCYYLLRRQPSVLDERSRS